MGERDPRVLTKEEFDQDPNLLFHGSPREILFDQEFDYANPRNIHETMSDGSATLGSGFYSIASKDEATNYSVIRQASDRAQAHVLSLLPYQAKMLDLRSRTRPEINGDLPAEFMQKWRLRFKQEVRRRAEVLAAKEKVTGMERAFQRKLVEYEKMLDQLIATGHTHPIRVVLGTGIDPELPFPTINMTNPPWIGLWNRFMREEGVDGVIAHEGGEGAKGKGGSDICLL